MSNSIFSVGTIVKGEDVGVVDFDTVSLVSEPAGSAITLEKFSARVGEVGSEIAALRKGLNDKYTADMFVKEVAVATHKKLVLRVDAIARSSRTFSEKPKKGEVFRVGKQTFSPLLNVWHMRVESPYKAVMAGYYSKAFKQFPTLRDALWRSLDFVVTNGPRQGFVARFLQGVNRPRTFKLSEGDLQLLKCNLVISPTILEEYGLREATGATVVRDVKVNLDAEAGLPYDVKRDSMVQIISDGKVRNVECLQLILGDAIRYFDAAAGSSNKNLSDWYSADPGRNVVKLKNKFERVDIKKVLTKIRPYYVMPGAQVIVWMYLWQVLKKHIPLFLDVDSEGNYLETVNAIGFSWANGGTDRLMEWVFSPAGPAAAPQLRGFHYADDGVWVATFGTRTFVACVDIEQEDSSLSLDYVRLAGKFVMDSWGDVSRVWGNVLKDNIRAATQMDILAYKQVVLRINGMMRSGVPGTSFFDLVAAAHNFSLYQGAFVEAFAGYGTDLPLSADLADTLTQWLVNASLKIYESTGLKLKAETMKFHEITEDMAELPIEFLGMNIVCRESEDGRIHYFPSFPKWKILADLWAPKMLDPPPSVKDASMFHKRVHVERIVAMTLLGGWLDTEMYQFLHDTFVDLMDQFQLLPIDGVFSSDEEYDMLPQLENYMRELREGSHIEFPTVEWCRSIYTGEDRSEMKLARVPFEKGKWSEIAELEDTKTMLMPGGPIELPVTVRTKTQSKIQIPKTVEDPLVDTKGKITLSAEQGKKQLVVPKVKRGVGKTPPSPVSKVEKKPPTPQMQDVSSDLEVAVGPSQIEFEL